jgi:hypothetical protein
MNMEQWARVRRKVMVEGQSKRSVMTEEHLQWETLQKIGQRQLKFPVQRQLKIPGWVQGDVL